MFVFLLLYIGVSPPTPGILLCTYSLEHWSCLKDAHVNTTAPFWVESEIDYSLYQICAVNNFSPIHCRTDACDCCMQTLLGRLHSNSNGLCCNGIT